MSIYKLEIRGAEMNKDKPEVERRDLTTKYG